MLNKKSTCVIATFTGRNATILLGLSSLPFTVKSQEYPRIDSLLQQYNGTATPGASLLVIKDGKKLLQRTYGSADLEHHVAVETLPLILLTNRNTPEEPDMVDLAENILNLIR